VVNSVDAAVRLEAFGWLERQVRVHGDVLPRDLLAAGFAYSGERVPIVGPQGIFKPRLCDLPLSMTTVPQGRGPRPYEDSFGADGLIRYRYRGTDPDHHENRGLKEAARRQIPLIYLHGVVPGEYVPVWPVFIVAADDRSLTFTVAVDDVGQLSRLADGLGAGEGVGDAPDEGRRRYITAVTRVRLHQRDFRERVLRAYQRRCAICRLRHVQLLDAAHIIPDVDIGGEPLVRNGLSLCKLHHAAFDAHIVGVKPDFVISVREDILHEEDGPMLLHRLQGVEGQGLQLPRRQEDWPDRERLAQRFELFRNAS
jgi:putative restriction endonuclease